MSEQIEKAAERLGKLMERSRPMEQWGRSGRGELFILKYLAEKGGASLPSELSKALGSSTARISAVLGALEKKGQVCREIDLSNRRNILVNITEEGRVRIDGFKRQMESHLISALAEMGERDATEFARLMERFFEITARTMPHDIIECENSRQCPED
ncbi:MAG: transcriptional regulator [Clostridiales Family XIII bacterium]|jgi:DNA-binding MarR family transcriptional regulator|nr:transcriptional regulator [Clostridiales Family XIII bacterium]